MKLIAPCLALLASFLPCALAVERPMVVVLDLSRSMVTNDPRKFALDGVELALATVHESKPFVVVGFGDHRKLLVPWTRMQSPAVRSDVRDRLTKGVVFDGWGTRYAEALAEVRTQLEGLQAPAGTRILFFTDGDPDDSSKDIDGYAQQFAARGWTIDAMRLAAPGDEAVKRDLRNLAQTTRGSHVEVTDAKELVDGFIRLAGSDNDFFGSELASLEEASRVVVPEGTERLLYVVERDPARGGSITGISRNGEALALDSPKIYRYPAQLPPKSGNIQVLRIDDPGSGTFSATLGERPRRVLVSVGFSVRFTPVALTSPVPEGTIVPLGISLDGQRRAAVAKAITSGGGVSAALVDQIDGRRLGELPLTADGDARFTGTWRSDLGKDAPKRDLNHPVAITYTVRMGAFALQKFDTVVVVPSREPIADPTLSTAWRKGKDEESIRLPPTWVGMNAAGNLSLDTFGPAGELRFVPNNGFSASPARVPASNQTVEIRYAPTAAGEQRTRLQSDGAVKVQTPELIGTAYAWPLGSNTLSVAGNGENRPSGIAPSLAAIGSSPAQPLTATSTDLSDAAGHHAKLTLNPDGTLSLTAPPDLPASSLSGTVTVTYGNLPPRTIPVRYDYAPAATVLAYDAPVLQLAPAAWPSGTWQETKVTVRLKAGAGGPVSAAISDLRGPEGDTFDAAHDLRITVNPGQIAREGTAEVVLRVYRGKDLMPGAYTGEASTIVAAPTGTSRFPIPVRVTVP